MNASLTKHQFSAVFSLNQWQNCAGNHWYVFQIKNELQSWFNICYELLCANHAVSDLRTQTSDGESNPASYPALKGANDGDTN